MFNRKEYRRQYYIDNYVTETANAKKLVLQTPASLMFKSAKYRSKKYNVAFAVNIKDIVIPEYCPVLGIKLIVGGTKITSGSPTLDRLIPRLGYTKRNIVVMSRRASCMRSGRSIADYQDAFRSKERLAVWRTREILDEHQQIFDWLTLNYKKEENYDEQ